MKIQRIFLVLGLVAFGVVGIAAVRKPLPKVAVCGAELGATGRAKRVLWIWMENHSKQSVLGGSKSSFVNELATACGLVTNAHNITHPSLPNYIAATSGGTQGITNNCDPQTCPISAPSIFGQLTASGKSWRSYQESMPKPCWKKNSGHYAPRHNPALYYADAKAKCNNWNVPFDQFRSDLASNTLPDFSFITPNLCNDTHDCSLGTGDEWLRNNILAITKSRAYVRGDLVIFLTWDEGENGGEKTDCAQEADQPGCQIATLVISARTKPGTTDGRNLTHYSLLRSTEEILDLPLLGEAKNALSMREPFGI